MIPVRAASPRRGRCRPRARGDGPMAASAKRSPAVSAPRTGGWSDRADNVRQAEKVGPRGDCNFIGLRREALWSEWRWETFAVWPVVAGQRSWGQSDSGGAGEGGSSPDESQDGPVLPDGVGLVSVA